MSTSNPYGQDKTNLEHAEQVARQLADAQNPLEKVEHVQARRAKEQMQNTTPSEPQKPEQCPTCRGSGNSEQVIGHRWGGHNGVHTYYGDK